MHSLFFLQLVTPFYSSLSLLHIWYSDWNELIHFIELLLCAKKRARCLVENKNDTVHSPLDF